MEEGLALDEAEGSTNTAEELGDVTAGTEEAGDVTAGSEAAGDGTLADGTGDEDGDAGPGVKELGVALLDAGAEDDGVAVGTETGIIENDNTGEALPGEGRGIAEREGMTGEDEISTAEDGETTGEEATGEETTGEETTGDETTGTGTTEDAGTLPVGELEGVALGVCTGVTDGEATSELDGIAEDDEGRASLEGDAVITALLEGVGVKTGVELGVSVTVELTVTVEQISCCKGPKSLALSNSTFDW
jgi:hypothetical protein